MKIFKSITMALIIICGLVMPSYGNALTNEFPNYEQSLSIDVGIDAEPFEINKTDIKQFPKPIKDYLEANANAKMVSTVIYHYRLVKNSSGETQKNLVKSFKIVDEETLSEFSNYSSSIQPLLETASVKPVDGQDILVGISTYSYSHPTKPTFYQVQGWWEWQQSSVGVFSAGYDLVGLTFLGETYGYDYYSLANNIWNHNTINLTLKSSNDNGVVYTHPSGSSLSYGAVLGKLTSSNANRQESFKVYFIYEYFESNPSPSYLSGLISWIIGNFVPDAFPLLSQNQRFDPDATLFYGNAQ